MQPTSKLQIQLPKQVISILKSKPECKSTFQFNKYIFFVASIYNGLNNAKAINSHSMYSLLGLSNKDGYTLKNNLIQWNLISEAEGVKYSKNADGKFKANNLTTYQFNQIYNLSKLVEHTFYNDKAKFISQPDVFILLAGKSFVEKLTDKEIQEITKHQPKSNISNKPKIKTIQAINNIQPLVIQPVVEVVEINSNKPKQPEAKQESKVTLPEVKKYKYDKAKDQYFINANGNLLIINSASMLIDYFELMENDNSKFVKEMISSADLNCLTHVVKDGKNGYTLKFSVQKNVPQNCHFLELIDVKAN